MDCGLSGVEVKRRLKKAGLSVHDLSGILLSHEHQDHIKGAGVLSRQLQLPLFANRATWEGASSSLGKIEPHNRVIINRGFVLGGMAIQSFSLPHDARDPVGFIIRYRGIRVGLATDLGCIQEDIIQRLEGCDLVILEANHDLELLRNGSYPPSLKKRILGPEGHLSNDDAGAVAARLTQAGVKKIILAHLSRDNNRPELAYYTVKNFITDTGAVIDSDLSLDLVEHFQSKDPINLK